MSASAAHKRTSVIFRHLDGSGGRPLTFLPSQVSAADDVKFITVEEAAVMTEGVRITQAPGFPALFAEALKNICYVKKIPFTRVKHLNMGIDRKTGADRQQRLMDLTSQTGLPVMWNKDERPYSVWTEQLACCEREGAPGTPALIPADYRLRQDVLGLCAIIVAEDGLLWNRRIAMKSPLGMKYGYTEEASEASTGKIVQILQLLTQRLKDQRSRGSKYLVGDAITAADVYMATFSYNLIVPSPELMPRTKENQIMEMMFGNLSDEIAAAMGPEVLEHREYIIKTYCETPSVLGGHPL